MNDAELMQLNGKEFVNAICKKIIGAIEDEAKRAKAIYICLDVSRRMFGNKMVGTPHVHEILSQYGIEMLNGKIVNWGITSGADEWKEKLFREYKVNV